MLAMEMLALERHKDLLLIGVRFEKLKMYENAKKLYTKYVKLVGLLDFENVVDVFYGYDAVSKIQVKTYDEAINKAMLIEKLKKLYLIIEKYRSDWNKATETIATNNDLIMNFFRWIATDQILSNDDLKIIEAITKILKKGVQFNITYYGNGSLIEVVRQIAGNSLTPNYYRNELR